MDKEDWRVVSRCSLLPCFFSWDLSCLAVVAVGCDFATLSTSVPWWAMTSQTASLPSFLFPCPLSSILDFLGLWENEEGWENEMAQAIFWKTNGGCWASPGARVNRQSLFSFSYCQGREDDCRDLWATCPKRGGSIWTKTFTLLVEYVAKISHNHPSLTKLFADILTLNL